jgi:hypothetical protein
MNQAQFKSLRRGQKVFRDDYDLTMLFSQWVKQAEQPRNVGWDEILWSGPCWSNSKRRAAVYQENRRWVSARAGCILHVPEGKGWFVTAEELLADFDVEI